jgi:hypothetical protein
MTRIFVSRVIAAIILKEFRPNTPIRRPDDLCDYSNRADSGGLHTFNGVATERRFLE